MNSVKVSRFLFWSVGREKHARQLLSGYKNTSLVLDFDNVHMVSQIFMKELLSIAEENELKLTFINSCKNVENMLQYVQGK